MAYNTRGFFNSTIKEIYQQTGALLSLEGRDNKDLLIVSLKNFEANVVYNWQRIVFPVFHGVVGSPHVKYSGFRSKPWAEYDVLDSVYGGVSGWTITAEPWATENGLPALWDEVNNQPHSITGALYYLAKKIENLEAEEAVEEEADQVDLTGQVNCLEANLETIFKDVYGCGFVLDCDGKPEKQFSIYTHISELFSQVITGGPNISIDSSCEDTYPTISLYMPVSNLTYDQYIPSTQVSGCSSATATIVDDLSIVRTFIGMDNCSSTTSYSSHLQGSETLNYITDADSLELTSYKLDQAIGNINTTVNNLDANVTLQEAYDNGDDSGQNPGTINLTNPTEGGTQGGISIFGHEINASANSDALSTPYFRVRDLVRGTSYGDGKYGNAASGSFHRVNQLFAISEHPISLNEAKDANGVLTDTDLQDYQYSSVHLYRSVLNMQPTGGYPNTRPYGSFSNTGSFDEVAIWVSSGKNKDGTNNTTVKDCNGSLVGGNNLYYRKPDSGTIYKLNKCGDTVNMRNPELINVIDWLEAGVNYPVGSVVTWSNESNSNDDDDVAVRGWCPGVVFYERQSLDGCVFGWNYDDPTDTTNSETTIESREITTGSTSYTGGGVPAGLTIRTLTDNAYGKVKFIEGNTSVDQAEIKANGSKMLFSTKGQERMAILGGTGSNVGFVGIGTSSPTQSLHLATSNDGEGILAQNLSTGAAFEAKYISGAGYGYQVKLDDNNNATTVFLRSYGDCYFKTGGSFGIGTDAPSEKLEVDGGVKVGNSTGTNDGTIRWNGSDLEVYKGVGSGWTSLTASGGSGSGLSNIVEDTTPQLGGDLDANGNDIDMGTNVITDTAVGQWNAAYSWGDHSGAGYTSNTGTVTSITAGADSGSGSAITSTGTVTFTGGANVTTSVSGTTVTIDATDTNTQLSQEQVEDYAGALIATGGTKTGITVTYQDSTGDIDFVVSDLNVAGDSGTTGMTPGDTLTIAGGTNVTTSMSGDTLTINATSSGSTSGGGLVDFQNAVNVHNSYSHFNSSRFILYRSSGSGSVVKVNAKKGFSVGDTLEITNTHSEVGVSVEMVGTDGNTDSSLLNNWKMPPGSGDGSPSTGNTINLASGKTIMAICESVTVANGAIFVATII